MKMEKNTISRTLESKEEVLKIEENILRLQFYYQFKSKETDNKELSKFIETEVLEDLGKMLVMAEMFRYKYDCGMIDEVKDLIETLLSGYDFYMDKTKNIEIDEKLFQGWNNPE